MGMWRPTGLLIVTMGMALWLGACKSETPTTATQNTPVAVQEQAPATRATAQPVAKAEPAASDEPVAGSEAAPRGKSAVAPRQSTGAAPVMPSGWTMVSDTAVGAPTRDQIAGRLGGALTGLRNTIYQVGDKRVQLNVISAASEDDAAKVMKSLLAMKSAEALLHKGRVIYEFVGPNAAMPVIRAGRAHLAR